MKSHNMKTHVKDYIDDNTLSDEKIQLLIDISSQYAEKKSWDQRNSRITWINDFVKQQKLALVASFMLIVVSFWGVANFTQNNALKSNFSQLVAQEIALNHNKQLSLDFNEIDYVKLNALMQKLDFKILESKNIQLAGLSVIGARYCSIQGNIAAQIRLKNKQGRIFTLYQTKLTDMLKNSSASEQSVGQVNVEQWQENDVFFGLGMGMK